MTEPTLEELLGFVLRDTGWIMAGGSAQFRQGALSELQSSLRLVRQLAGSERLLNAVKILGDKASATAAHSNNDTDTIMSLRRSLEEFEAAMKAYLATAKKR
ncbi:MAG: hypothetical protein JSS44_07635 [Proteobacteria bacterium]|nr:hypothetical protein [Pseudomonadota bacterium]MBS0462024.1 hypothetical protein [Pseudomonadota bacterium]